MRLLRRSESAIVILAGELYSPYTDQNMTAAINGFCSKAPGHDVAGQRATNKKSLLSVGVLMLSLAALQSPLWRGRAAVAPVSVRSGGASLVSTDRPIANAVIDQPLQASVEVVGEREVLVRGKALGEAHLTIASNDGGTVTYRVLVQAESARSFTGSSNLR